MQKDNHPVSNHTQSTLAEEHTLSPAMYENVSTCCCELGDSLPSYSISTTCHKISLAPQHTAPGLQKFAAVLNAVLNPCLSEH